MIKSIQNPKIKLALKLKKSRDRKKEDLILIEGRHEISLAVNSGVEIATLFYSNSYNSDNRFKVRVKKEATEEVEKEIFKKISYRENPDGYLALARPKKLSLNQIKLSKNPLVLILDAIEKPGNLGAILRTADGAGVDAVIINNPVVDIYNPNVIRASLGTIFTKKVVLETAENTEKWLKLNKIVSCATTLNTSVLYTKKDYKNGSAIIIGSEHGGISSFWEKNANFKIKIPMLGKIDSLNASVSTAIILYEIRRQRA